MPPEPCASPVVSVVSPPYSLKEDGLYEQPLSVPYARLENSKILKNLEGHLSHLCDSAKSDICRLIRDHAALFGDKPTQTTVLTHDIDVGGHRPIKQHAYRINPAKREVMHTEVTYLLEKGFTVPSSSPWSAPSLLVPKSDLGLRNAPATFQRLMNTVLSGVKNCDAYLDDIVAYSSSWSNH